MSDKQWVFDNPQEAADLIEQQAAEIDALKAHIERLREVVIEYHSEIIASEEAVNELWEIHKQTLQQSLAEHDAEVARLAAKSGFVAAIKYVRSNPDGASNQRVRKL